jgi:hypothetical protein
MKTIITSVLILTVVALAGYDTTTPISSSLMTAGQMAAATGAGFWGGLVCGFAVIGTVAAGAAIITAVGAGTTVSLGVAFAFSAAAHADAICALLS